jgi:hypothetical protein
MRLFVLLKSQKSRIYALLYFAKHILIRTTSLSLHYSLASAPIAPSSAPPFFSSEADEDTPNTVFSSRPLSTGILFNITEPSKHSGNSSSLRPFQKEREIIKEQVIYIYRERDDKGTGLILERLKKEKETKAIKGREESNLDNECDVSNELVT